MGFSATGLSWVQNAYTLVFGGLLLLGARARGPAGPAPGVHRRAGCLRARLVPDRRRPHRVVADRRPRPAGHRRGRRRPLVAVPAHRELRAAEQRTRAVAAYGTVAGIGASVGLVVGGALADLISWRAGFFLNVPIGAAMIGRRPPVPARHPAQHRAVRPARGAVLATLGMGALVLGIVHSRRPRDHRLQRRRRHARCRARRRTRADHPGRSRGPAARPVHVRFFTHVVRVRSRLTPRSAAGPAGGHAGRETISEQGADRVGRTSPEHTPHRHRSGDDHPRRVLTRAAGDGSEGDQPANGSCQVDHPPARERTRRVGGAQPW